MITGTWYNCGSRVFLVRQFAAGTRRYSIRKFSLTFPKVKNQRGVVPGHHGRLRVNTKSDAAYMDEVNAANTVDALTHTKACWVQTPSLSLAGIVSSLLGKELPTDPTFRLSRWSSPLNAQLVMLL